MTFTGLNRRELLLALAAGGSALLGGGAAGAPGGPAPVRTRMGIVTYALGIHQRNRWEGRHQGLAPALAFLEECRILGAGGIQFQFGPQDLPHAAEVRRRAEAYQMHVEAIIDPPAGDSVLEQFEQKVKAAKEAGAAVARTVILPGRRYEQFKTLAEFREYEARGMKSLQRAEPVLSRQDFRLAVENHKDQVISEKLDMLKRLGSERIGLCVDVGNNFALMEDPLEAVRAFAPWAFTVHLKDQAVADCPEGFLLSDAALGEGFLDLPAMVEILRKAKPEVKFNLETITRDAIKLPVLTDGFWASLPHARAPALARAAGIIKSRPHAQPPAAVSRLPVEEQLRMERRNVEQSIAYAREHLGL